MWPPWQPLPLCTRSRWHLEICRFENQVFCHFDCKCHQYHHPSICRLENRDLRHFDLKYHFNRHHYHQCVSVRVHSSSQYCLPDCKSSYSGCFPHFPHCPIVSGGGGQKDQPDRELSSPDHDTGTSLSLK